MRKAKEYAQDIVEAFVVGDIDKAKKKGADVIKQLLLEAEQIYKARQTTNYGPLLAVLKEQHIKWMAICRRVNKEVDLLPENLFLKVIEKQMTMVYPNLVMIL